MTENEINAVVQAILRNDGPDRHVDGHEILTSFIVADKEGEGWEWIEKYMAKKGILFNDVF